MRLILVVALAVLGLGPSPAEPGDPFADLTIERPAEARPAPPLSLPALSGRMVKVPDDFRGKVVLLGFFTTT
jgi:hypothetical protein